MQKIGVLFVCHGNICRSPAAEATFRTLITQEGLANSFHVDSAGTSAYHIGESPHAHTVKAALKRGIILEHAARQFMREDFERFDLILAMDRYNLEDILRKVKEDEHKQKVFIYRHFDPEKKDSIADVPDPYYGGMDGFDHVQEILLRTSKRILSFLREEYKLA